MKQDNKIFNNINQDHLQNKVYLLKKLLNHLLLTPNNFNKKKSKHSKFEDPSKPTSDVNEKARIPM